MSNAIILLSGGLDSATILAMARAQGFSAHALSFRYGQRHSVELRAARQVALAGQATQHRIVDIDLAAFGGSALTDLALAVPKGRAEEAMAANIPITYVPARNTIFLSYALAWAEVLPARDIFIGVNALDYSGYPDCRPDFIDAFTRVANLGSKIANQPGALPLRIHAPLIDMKKSQIIAHGLALGVDYGLTCSCYDPTEESGRIVACGECDACILRRKGFAEAGCVDPIAYWGRA